MSDLEFYFDKRLQFAETLPASWYFDSEILAREKERVFARTWQLVGRLDQVASPGDYFTATVADEPLIVVRGSDQKLRAFSNVCRHRAGPVAAGEGKRSVFRCGYHGWSYSIDGRLIATPEFEGVECFQKESVCLPEFNVDTWESLVFVKLDSAGPGLQETFGDITKRIGPRDFASMPLSARKDWYIDCNWKTYVDNYLEGYHIPIVHPSLNRELDYGRYRTETQQYYSIQHSPIKKVNDGKLRLDPTKDDNEAQFYWIFPNLMLNVYPDNYSTNLIIPIGPDRTLTVFEWFFRNPEDPDVKKTISQTIEFSDEIQIEDIAICETVQRGLRSRTYNTGRYSVKRENGVHHFHGLLAEFFGKD